MQSMHGIAIRTKKGPAGKIEFHFAVVSDKGVTHVINGRNGSIRRIEGVDQLQDDWTPFQVKPATTRKPKITEKDLKKS